MFELAEIGARLRTQDSRFTAEPIFVVQETVNGDLKATKQERRPGRPRK